MAREESRAGGMTGMGIHVLDCLRELNGPMRRVSALSKSRVLNLPAGDTTAALITVLMIGFISKASRIKEDAAIGIMYTAVFAAGGMLASRLPKWNINGARVGSSRSGKLRAP